MLKSVQRRFSVLLNSRVGCWTLVRILWMFAVQILFLSSRNIYFPEHNVGIKALWFCTASIHSMTPKPWWRKLIIQVWLLTMVDIFLCIQGCCQGFWAPGKDTSMAATTPGHTNPAQRLEPHLKNPIDPRNSFVVQYLLYNMLQTTSCENVTLCRHACSILHTGEFTI